ncbi:MAG TPA: P1 family peptidase [Trebonia sp.]|nr:P1 family peptidase [Trebonia sp.]
MTALCVTGPANSLTDVRGLRAGHATLTGDGWLTGVTVVVTGPDGATGGVDVRGGGPGTRETDLLGPLNQVERVNAIVLAGGSAYGLSAAHGVMTRLGAMNRGFRMGPEPSHVVPIVPAAILFDLGRGGDFGNYPGPPAGQQAFDAALAAPEGDAVAAGCVGAGTGALAGQLKGGTGSASEVLEQSGITVAALAVVNAAGSVASERTGLLHGAPFGLPGEFDWLAAPSAAELAAGAARLTGRPRTGPGTRAEPGAPRPLNTTIGVIGCDASLTKAQCAKLAQVAHDGMARAIRPAHSMFDGDTIFALATGSGPPATPLELHAILASAADCFTRAVVHGVLSASSATTPAGSWPSYLDLFPSVGARAGG